jgi:hypothetical protein
LYLIAKPKIIGIISIILGVFLSILPVLFDFFQGKPIYFGVFQLILLAAGMLLLIYGFLVYACRITHYDHTIDVIVVFLITAYALLYFCGKWGSLTPSPELWSDAASITGDAVAVDHPNNFINDPLLGNRKNSIPYNFFYIPLITFLSRLFGDYSLATLVLLPACIIIQLVGFYLLGKAVFKNRILAIILLLITSIQVQYGAWDYWGLFTDPQPRFLFQAFLPFIFLLAIRWKSKPTYWPLVMALIGLATYIHILSGPAIAFIVWVGFLLIKRDNVLAKKHISWILLTGCTYLIVISPILIKMTSMGPFFSSETRLSYAESYAFIQENYAVLLDIQTIIISYFKSLISYGILIPSIIGLIITISVRSEENKDLFLMLLWLGSLLVFSSAIPLFEHTIMNSLRILPLEFDFVRNLRYTIPLWILIALIGLNILRSKLITVVHKKIMLIGINLLIIFSGGVWFMQGYSQYILSSYYINDYAFQTIKCIRQQKLFCPSKYKQNVVSMLNYIDHNIPIFASFISIPSGKLTDQIRYRGLRSVAFSDSDSLRMSYYDISKAKKMSTLTEEWHQIKQLPKDHQIVRFINFACVVGATYVLAERTYDDQLKKNDDLMIIFQNSSFSIAQILDCLNPCISQGFNN